MMPPPEEVARLVDDGERLVLHPPLADYPSERKRRILAEAAFEYLRHGWDGATAPQPVPASGQ